MTHEIILAGFGGQGVQLVGRLLIAAGMKEGKKVSWLPSYGAEMRGGPSSCEVVLSEEEVYSPVLSKASAGIVMSALAFDKYEPIIREGGVLIVNESLVTKKTAREGVRAVYVPSNDIATELGSMRVVNMVLLGAFLKATGAAKVESVLEALRETLGESRRHLVDINKRAMEMGAGYVK